MSTIAAISTSPGIGGIGIIRISGEKAFDILEKILRTNNKEIQGYTMKYGNIVENGEVIDEVLVSYFIAPNSYTRENVCEINSHGGIIVMKRILQLCLKYGAVLAEPGEFTKRAFLNGRIDLAQAEAVIDIINSKTDREAKASVDQLQGNLSSEITNIRQELISMMADIEASIDYPEYDVEEVTNNRVIKTLEDVKEKLIFLEKSFDNGKILKEGIKTAIIGRPNAGKSSLLNILLNEERAIVTDIEGTTRDTIEEYISINGIPLKIIDTAGIRTSKDEVEKIGIEKAKKIAKESDVIIGIFDISQELNDEDEEIIDILKNKNSIILLNKIDLNKENVELDRLKEINKPLIKISTKERTGIKELYNEIEKIIENKEITSDNEIIVTNTRHKNLIMKAVESLNKSFETIENDMPIDIIVVYIKDILECLGEITG